MRVFLMTMFTVLGLGALPLAAQDDEMEEARSVFGGDRFIAGSEVAADAATEGDLFMAGERLRVTAPVAGTAHMAGRRLLVDAPVGGALYAMGYEVRIEAPVTGAATLAAAEIEIAAEIGGNLRAAASELMLGAPVRGAAMLAGEDVILAGPIEGDASIASDDLSFLDGARVDGMLIVYTDDPETVEVPDWVAPAERVETRDARQYELDHGATFEELRERSVAAAIRGFVISVVVVAALASAALLLAPDWVARLRTRTLETPGASLVRGFVTISAVIGGGILFAMTVIGIPLLPAAILVAVLACIAGYVLGSYILGVGVWLGFGRPAPEGIGVKIGLAALGAFLAGLAMLVPFLGWIFAMALSLAGVGAIMGQIRGGGATTY